MAVSYNNLWKLLIDRKVNKSTLCKRTGISSSTMAKLTREDMLHYPGIGEDSAELECNIGDIMEFNNLEKIRKENTEG